MTLSSLTVLHLSRCPFTSGNRGTDCTHLVFTVLLDLDQSTEHRKVYIIQGETQPLTEILLIPNAENAVVDIRKLHDYCLNPDHDQGKHKARLFSTLLGMTADDAEELRKILLEVVRTHEAQLG